MWEKQIFPFRRGFSFLPFRPPACKPYPPAGSPTGQSRGWKWGRRPERQKIKKIFTPLNFEEQHSLPRETCPFFLFNWGVFNRGNKSCLPREMFTP
jgi:hypothetical protein